MGKRTTNYICCVIYFWVWQLHLTSEVFTFQFSLPKKPLTCLIWNMTVFYHSPYEFSSYCHMSTRSSGGWNFSTPISDLYLSHPTTSTTIFRCQDFFILPGKQFHFNILTPSKAEDDGFETIFMCVMRKSTFTYLGLGWVMGRADIRAPGGLIWPI